MRHRASQSAQQLAVLWCCIAVGWAADERVVFRDAVAAMQRGDFRAAEQKLRPEVAARPNDAAALSLLGVALDNQNQFREAAELHRRAVAAAPRSADVLNNYGNHLAAAGEDAAAREVFLKAIVVDPANVNANVQLARQSLKRKNGAEALRYLRHMPPGQLAVPNVALVQLEALYLAGDGVQADALAAQLTAAVQGDAGMSFSLGLVLANNRRFAVGEMLLVRVLVDALGDVERHLAGRGQHLDFMVDHGGVI
jgi:Tfp pilus assembly protein PilF